MSISGCLRDLARPILAGLIVIALLIPTLDAFKCVAEFDPVTVITAAKHYATTIVAKDISGKPLDADGGADPLCPHSHCHHLPAVPSAVVPAGMPTALAYSEPILGINDALASQPPLSLLRPPRA